MNDNARFDRTLTAWLDEQAPPREPDRLLEAVTAEVAHTRRLPGWVIPERWIPMQTRALFGAIPRTVVILALLALLVASAAVIAAGQAPRLPPPVGPAANGLIAYDSGGDIWVVRDDGSEARQLTTGPAVDRMPSWSRDGTRLAYWSQDAVDAPSQLIVVDADGTEPITIATDEEGRVPDPGMRWSPDGAYIAFSLDRGCASGDFGALCDHILIAATAAPGDAERIGGPGIYGINPVWSPDGTTLAFGGWNGDQSGLIAMGLDGSDVRLLAPGGLWSWSFWAQDWSPDGTRIATMAGGYPDNEILVIEADGSGEINVSNHRSNDTDPRWSPDGESLLWFRGSQPTPDGTDDHSIVLGPDGEPRPVGPQDYFGSWSPDGSRLLGGNGDDTSAGLIILDSESGEIVAEIPTPDRVDSPSWQRLAP
jgi:TolB protein